MPGICPWLGADTRGPPSTISASVVAPEATCRHQPLPVDSLPAPVGAGGARSRGGI